MRLYLASTSPARLALLRSSGIEPILHAPDVDEDAVSEAAELAAGAPHDPADLVLMLARAKAEAVAAAPLAAEPDAASAAPAPGEELRGRTGLVLGGDSMFVIDGVTYGKPHTPENATARWHLQRGKTGQLLSGHWLIEQVDGVSVRAAGAVTVADVTFADDISDAEIDAYVATGEPLFVAGAFTIDSLGAGFITHISGDPSTVVGLSLPALRRLVRGMDLEWTDLWNRQ
ncbi:Maf family protein [Leifsonia sp. A12D58]|uniref:Maf family protein n=1 Tax=Leifsonia sp. A12D58 TaxID=3397674 RepID=UPI0039E1D463